MYLHDAIREVLRQHGAPMSSSAIAQAINAAELYSRADGHPLEASQVSARASNYGRLFERTADGAIELRP